MTRRPALRWHDPADRAWADRLRFRLALHHEVPADVWEPALAEAHEAHRTSGRPVAELFGDPDAHAARIAEERFPLERRAAADLQGASPADRWRLLPLVVGWAGAVTSAVLLLDRGWWVDVGPAGLVVSAGVGGAVVAATRGLADRRLGEVRRSRWWFTLTAAVVLGAGVAAPALGDRPALVEVPLLATLLLSVALVALGLRLLARAPSPAPAPRDETPEQWFTRLSGVLRGRHLLRRREVRHRVAAAREAWRAGGRDHPAEAWVLTGITAFATWTVLERAVDGHLERELLWMAPLAVVMAWGTATRWRRVRAAAVAGDTAGGTTRA